MIKNIRIKNFRGITNLKADDFQRINLFVGENNCGKTTLLEALFILTNPVNPQLPIKTNLFRDYNEINGHSLKMLFNDLNINKKIELSFDRCNPNEKRKLEIKANKKKLVKINNNSNQNNKINLNDNYSNTGETFEIDGLVFNFHLKNNSNTKNYKTELILHPNQGYEVNRKNNVKYTENFEAIFNSDATIKKDNLSNRFDSIQIKKRKENVVNILKSIEPDLEDLSIGSRDVVYADIGLDSLIPINSLGNGMIKLLYIVSSIADNPNGIVLIDEIENGFHYSSQKTLWKAIWEAAKEFNVQLFITTHSLETIRALKEVYSNNKNLNDNKNEDLKLYRIEKKNSKFKVIDYDYNTIKTTLEKGWDLR